MTLIWKTRDELEAERDGYLRNIRMTLEEARDQWSDCGCCLEYGNYEALADLERIQSIDWLLDQ